MTVHRTVQHAHSTESCAPSPQPSTRPSTVPTTGAASPPPVPAPPTRANLLRALGQVASAGDPVGRYSWRPHDDAWSWSPRLRELYGHDRFSSPTTDLWLAQLRPTDRAQGQLLLAELRRGLRSFSWCHAIAGPDGRTRTVVESGWVLGSERATAVCHGLVDDISRQVDAAASQAVEASSAHRQQINQAQGAVMLSHGISADAALALLIGCSQQHNVKLALLADRVVEALRQPGRVADPAAMDRLVHRAATGPHG